MWWNIELPTCFYFEYQETMQFYLEVDWFDESIEINAIKQDWNDLGFLVDWEYRLIERSRVESVYRTAIEWRWVEYDNETFDSID